MKYFETRYGGGIGAEEVRIEPYQERLWAAAFGVENLELLFDLEIPERALSRLDEAINRFNHQPETLRHLLDDSDNRGLIGNRRVLEQMRQTLADHPDASISGLMER
ncbi:hypothetical protein [Nocardia brasiliensis]|uniref:hypothetical protein n=1 Tax=Nocardia brasiliensis TaxID=37326 RepID=UPI002453E77A|nr:hypothetical protein [Nocardia brasiliensis]